MTRAPMTGRKLHKVYPLWWHPCLFLVGLLVGAVVFAFTTLDI